MARKSKEYALYRGDEFVDIGTAEFLANKYNTSANTIRWRAGSNRYKSKDHKNGYIVISLD
jgi:hypothetical protein